VIEFFRLAEQRKQVTQSSPQVVYDAEVLIFPVSLLCMLI